MFPPLDIHIRNERGSPRLGLRIEGRQGLELPIPRSAPWPLLHNPGHYDLCRQGGFRALWAGLVTMVLGDTLCCAWGGGNVSAGDAADCVAYNSVCVTGKESRFRQFPVFQLRTHMLPVMF